MRFPESKRAAVAAQSQRGQVRGQGGGWGGLPLQQFILQSYLWSFLTTLCPHPQNPGVSVLRVALKGAKWLTRE